MNYRERKALAAVGKFNPIIQCDVLRALVDLQRDSIRWTMWDLQRESGWSRAYVQHALYALVARGVIQEISEHGLRLLSARYHLATNVAVDSSGQAYTEVAHS